MVGMVNRLLEVLSIEWVREIILFVLGIILAIQFIPREIKRLEVKSNRKLIKELLKGWGADCERAIVLAMPMDVRHKWLRIEKDGRVVESDDGFRVNEYISQVWKEIREGEREPKGLAWLVDAAVWEVMYSREEKKGERTLIESEPKYQLKDIHGRERELPKAFVSWILNTIYAKVEIFDRELLPVRELEGAMEHLEFFRAKDEIIRSQLILYAGKLARSMEMFGEYLWKLEGWPNKSRRRSLSSGIRKLSHMVKEGDMGKRYRKGFRYARLVFKPAGFAFVVAGIAIFVVQVLGSVEESMGRGGLVFLIVGGSFWLLDTLFSTIEDWEKLRKEAREDSEGPK